MAYNRNDRKTFDPVYRIALGTALDPRSTCSAEPISHLSMWAMIVERAVVRAGASSGEGVCRSTQ